MKKIKLTKGKYTLVDDEDFEYLNKWKWHASLMGSNWYAIRNNYHKETQKQSKVRMHRVINNTPNNKITDHIDGNGLNNQRKNLRTCTHSENSKNVILNKNNAIGFKGIRWVKNRNRFRTCITSNKKTYELGSFKTLEEAIEAYNKGALQYHGRFARLNIIKRN